MVFYEVLASSAIPTQFCLGSIYPVSLLRPGFKALMHAEVESSSNWLQQEEHFATLVSKPRSEFYPGQEKETRQENLKLVQVLQLELPSFL